MWSNDSCDIFELADEAYKEIKYREMESIEKPQMEVEAFEDSKQLKLFTN